jgi:hypothetical protein
MSEPVSVVLLDGATDSDDDLDLMTIANPTTPPVPAPVMADHPHVVPSAVPPVLLRR